MKKILFVIIELLCTAMAGMSQTNVIPAVDVDKLNGGVDSLLPLLPAQWQHYIVPAILLISLAGHIGRVIVGYRSNGIAGALAGLFGGVNTPHNVPTTSDFAGLANALQSQVAAYPVKTGMTLKSAAPLLLAAVFAGLLLVGSGCANTSMVNHQTGTGFNARIPIGYNGANVFELDLQVGAFKNTQVLAPVSTNVLHSPGIVVASSDGGTISDSLTGTAGTGTNTLANGSGGAALSGGDSDVLTLGDATMSMTNWSTVVTHGSEALWHGASRLNATNTP